MSRLSEADPYLGPHYREGYDLKTQSFSSFNEEPLANDGQDDQEEQNSRSNTPSMTIGSSSKSTSSSIVTCNNCGDPDRQCCCQSHSELGSTPYGISGPACWNSPNPAHSTLVRQSKESLRPWSQQSSPRLDVIDTSAGRSPLSKATTSQLRKVELLKELSTTAEQNMPLCKSTKLNVSTPLNSEECPNDSIRALQSEVQPQEDAMDLYHNDSDTSDDNEDDANDWSGQDANLEAIILDALQGDLVLAAQLIPMLHNSLYTELALNITQKVGPWRRGITKCSPGSGTTPTDQRSFTNTRSSDTISNGRKRQRRSEFNNQNRKINEDDDEEEEDEDEKREPIAPGDASDGINPLPRLACLFNKHNPMKYGVQYGNTADTTNNTEYRICAGPGFNGITRLKEHLKRKHYPVQCDRCYRIFPGSDRAACVQDLQIHRQHPTPCERKSSSLKEGISDAQWANLEKKKNNKNQQATSRVAKWFEIWDFIFPESPRPKTPWYDNGESNRQTQPPSPESRRFGDTFAAMLNHLVNQQDIRFAEGAEDVMMARVNSLAQRAFAVTQGIHRNLSSTDSSSSRLFLGGAYEQIERPRTISQHHSSSASRSTTGRSQVFSIDLASSPTPGSMPGRRTSMMGPPYMGGSQIVGEFPPRDLQSGGIAQSSYQADLNNDISAFGDNSFQASAYSAPGSNWDIHFNGLGSQYVTVGTGGFVDGPGRTLDQTLTGGSEDDAQAELRNEWPQQLPGPPHTNFASR